MQTTETITLQMTKSRDEEKLYYDDIFQVFIGLVENRHSEQAQVRAGDKNVRQRAGRRGGRTVCA